MKKQWMTRAALCAAAFAMLFNPSIRTQAVQEPESRIVQPAADDDPTKSNTYDLSDSIFDPSAILSIDGQEVYDGMPVENGDSFSFELDFSLPDANDYEFSENDQFIYTFPDELQINPVENQPIYFPGSDTEAGTYSIENNELIIHFSRDFYTLSDRSVSLNLSGHLHFSADQLKQDYVTIVIPAGNTVTFDLYSGTGLSVSKTAVKQVDEENGKIYALYTLTITALVDNTDVTITDTPDANVSPITSSASAVSSGGASDAVLASEDPLTWTVSDMPRDSTVTITYKAQLPSGQAGTSTSPVVCTNSVSASSDQSNAVKAASSLDAYPLRFDKSGTFNEKNRSVTWTLTLIPGDFDEATIQDVLMDSLEDPSADIPVTIQKNGTDWGTTTFGQLQSGYAINDPDHSPTDTYTFTFTLPLKSTTALTGVVKNRALIPDQNIYVTRSVAISPTGSVGSLNKELVSLDQETNTLTWSITVDVDSDITGMFTLLDFIPSYFPENNSLDQTMVQGSVSVTKDGQPFDWQAAGGVIDWAEKHMQIDFANGIDAGVYVMTIQTTYDRVAGSEAEDDETSLRLRNTGGYRAYGLEKDDEATTWVDVNPMLKSGTLTSDDVITWTLNLYGDFFGQSAVIHEILPDGLEFLSATYNDQTIDPSSQNGSDLTFDLSSPSAGDVIVIKTKVTDYTQLTENTTYTNQAWLETNGTNYPIKEASVSVDAPTLVEKSGVYNTDTAPFVNYTVQINPDQLNLIEDSEGTGQYIVAEDTLGSGLRFMPGTLKVNGVTWTNYIQSGQTLRIYGLEDETAYTITYTARVILDPGQIFDSENGKNILSLLGTSYANNSDASVLSGSVVESAASAQGSYWTVQIIKTDENGQGLPGAQFTVYYYGDGSSPDGDGMSVETFETGADGKSGEIELDYDDIYRIVETKAPAGYEGSADTGYFVRPGEDTTTQYDSSVQVLDDTDTHTWTFTNALQTTDVTVTKTWDDQDNAWGTRPDALTVHLLKNGTDTGQTLTLSEDNGWKGSFENLPVMENGQNIDWTIEEDAVSGYSTKTSQNSNGSWTITNALQTTGVDIYKFWQDQNNAWSTRPESVNIHLLKDGTDTGKTLTLSENSDCKGSFENLPFTENGQNIDWTFEEDAMSGYSTETSQNSDGSWTITNTLLTTGADIYKFWEDQDNVWSTRPEFVNVHLLKDGTDTGKTLTLSEDNGWKGSFENLPLTENGQNINWTIEEDAVSGYSTETSQNSDGSWNITNTLLTTGVDIYKFWEDQDNVWSTRPEFINIHLLKDGTDTGQALILSESNDWKGSFDNLPLMENGQNIDWSVEEDAVSGYSSEISQNSDGSWNITNTLLTTDVDIYKFWEDQNNVWSTRPEFINIHLLKDGTDTGKTLTLSADNNWKGSFEYLPVMENGQTISWSVKEDSVSGYVTVISQEADGSWTVTNTLNEASVAESPDEKKTDPEPEPKTSPAKTSGTAQSKKAKTTSSVQSAALLDWPLWTFASAGAGAGFLALIFRKKSK